MELIIDVSKARVLNTGKLVKRAVQVKGQGGRTFTRMQWINPDKGKPVMETSHEGHEDPHTSRVNSMNPEQKHSMVNHFVSNHRDEANDLAMATGQRRAPHVAEHQVTQHLMDHAHKIPHEYVKDHLDSKEAKPSLNVVGSDLPEKEVNKRMGKEGSLDLNKLTTGASMYDDSIFKEDTEYAQEDGLNPEKEFKHIFKDVTKSGIEDVFSDPKGEWTASLSGYDLFEDEGNVNCGINMSLYDKDGEKMGHIIRSAHYDEEGTLQVHNDEMYLESQYHGKGVANTVYNRSEQLWKHLSGGHKVGINLTANISIGAYAWAKKGFDFSDDKQLRVAKAELEGFCKENKIDLSDVLKKSGYEGIDDLQHSWQFATLQNGKSYNLESVIDPQYKNDVKGREGHFGKAFMLGGLGYWYGKKTLNDDHSSEKVGEIHGRRAKENS
ncbi:PE-PGRS family protein [Bacillus phage Shanette]|uniref:PE-PGRS family protein n=1 Tax=Bacillus phage Shanette TaxID=1296656 RepID=S5M526_9CAUD|nr:PE-PGRS family protein [Bacillus phage Shanette]AGR46981.1 PE-PGRS family protein [Bacillus phage Shanette]